MKQLEKVVDDIAALGRGRHVVAMLSGPQCDGSSPAYQRMSGGRGCCGEEAQTRLYAEQVAATRAGREPPRAPEVAEAVARAIEKKFVNRPDFARNYNVTAARIRRTGLLEAWGTRSVREEMPRRASRGARTSMRIETFPSRPHET